MHNIYISFFQLAAGLISTLVNVYSQQEGVWSIIARITAIVTGTIMCVTGGLFGVYNFWALRRVRRGHEREMNSYSAEDHEGLMEEIRRR
ncbi:hypothetical protein DID88_009066 [Monilinia fructigena]|uniref:Uncharacterized protein n=1 Tax=Monilinia fructigena TaxID=38457 RepID=A0A395IF79_9HELO|nr:hypothetical protein DID88_009066 [Monilinia fructigena]